MSFEVEGKIIVLNPTIQVSEKFSKREFVLKIESNNPQYPESVAFQLSQDKCNLLDGLNVGDDVAVGFNLKGREWNSPQGEVKYFNTLDAWKINRINTSAPQKAMQPNTDFDKPKSNAPMPGAKADDLPF